MARVAGRAIPWAWSPVFARSASREAQRAGLVCDSRCLEQFLCPQELAVKAHDDLLQCPEIVLGSAKQCLDADAQIQQRAIGDECFGPLERVFSPNEALVNGATYFVKRCQTALWYLWILAGRRRDRDGADTVMVRLGWPLGRTRIAALDFSLL